MPKHVVVLGGGFSAVIAVQEITKIDSMAKVTVISPSSHLFFNVATPRALVNPDYPSKIFFPLKKIFAKQISKGHVTVVQGKAIRTNFEDNQVVYLSEDKEVVESYDALVLATGTRSELKALKLDGGHEESLKAIEEIAATVKKAKTIAVAGGGPTGVEIASEVKQNYPQARVILYTGCHGPLEAIDKIHATTKKLTALGVEIVNKVMIASQEELDDGKINLYLSNNETITVDAYIPAIGLLPNSQYIDSDFLDEDGYVITENTLIVKGTKNVIAVGDLVSGTPNSIVVIKFTHMSALVSTLKNLLLGSKITHTYKPPTSATHFVPTGSKGGIGVLFGWSVPSFVVAKMKSKDFMLSKAFDDYGTPE